MNKLIGISFLISDFLVWSSIMLMSSAFIGCIAAAVGLLGTSVVFSQFIDSSVVGFFQNAVSLYVLEFIIVILGMLLSGAQLFFAFKMLKRRTFGLVGFCFVGLINGFLLVDPFLLILIPLTLIVLPWVLVFITFKNEESGDSGDDLAQST